MRSELLTIAVTGANGFVGSNLVRFLKNKKCSVREIQRKNKVGTYQIKSIDSSTEWDNALKNIDIVVHCAGYAHHISKRKKDKVINNLNCKY